MALLPWLPYDRLAYVLAGGAVTTVGALVLAYGFRERLHQALALLLLCLAGTLLLLPWSNQVDSYTMRLSVYFVLATPPAALFFLHEYRLRYHGPASAMHRTVAPAVPWILLAATVGVLWTYAVEHAAYASAAKPGPLYVLDAWSFALLGLIGFVLARDARTTGEETRRQWLLLGSLAFLAVSVHQATRSTLFALRSPTLTQGVTWASFPYPAGTIALGAVTLVLAALAVRFAADIPRSRDGGVAARFPWSVAAAAATAVAFVLLNMAFRRDALAFGNWMLSLWWMLAAGLLAYALLRHHLFDLDARLRVGVAKGTVGAAFITVFFVVGEMAQAVVERLAEDNVSLQGAAPYVGIVAAGCLIFVLHPLQSLGERFGRAAAPKGKPLTRMTLEERRGLYRAQATLAWIDGKLLRKERIILMNLRERLRLSAEDASSIEAQVLAAHLAAQPARRRTDAVSRAEGE